HTSRYSLWGCIMTARGALLSPDLQQMIREKHWDALRDYLTLLDPSDVAEVLVQVPDRDDAAIFRLLPRDHAGQVFAYLPSDHQQGLLRTLDQRPDARGFVRHVPGRPGPPSGRVAG